MSKSVLALDVDEVLAFHNEALARHHNRVYGTNHKTEEYHEDWASIWGVDAKEVEKRAAGWHVSDEFKTMKPVPGAIEALKKLEIKYELIIITGRSRKFSDVTEAWLHQHYPAVFKNIHSAGLWEEGKGTTKADLCRKLHVDILIDDSVTQAVACAQAGVRVLLFGDYPWNQADELPKGVERVNDWPAVLRELL